ncbi:MAG: flavodoxin-dependent (E)-4-hydroxy-3-methylbut-2-enyl-diphosphate synthase [Candidatus Omnitrophota bacterium]
MKISRRKTKVINIGRVCIGGNNPIAVQSMVKCKTSNIESAVRQIKELEACGCEIVRLAIKDNDDAIALKKIKRAVSIPLVGDIHFDWRLGLAAIDNGIDKIRLNPGNIYKKAQIREIVKASKLGNIPIRLGLNSGSLPRVSRIPNIADKMVKAALDYIKILEGFKFYDIVVSLKASNIFDTVHACRKLSKLCGYPLHLGVTASGLPSEGIIKSSIAIGGLLSEGIGDTIRVSLTDTPGQEIKAAQSILKALDLANFGPEIISCPTCGRCEVDLVKIVKELEKKLSSIVYGLWTRPIKLAVMGCVVNGPGEASQADIGIAFGKKEGMLFKKGKPVRKVSVDRCIDVLLEELRGIINV